MEPGEFLIGLLIFGVVIGGVLFYALVQQRAAIDQTKTPSLPPERDPAVLHPEAIGHMVVELRAGQSLAEQLRVHANKAEARGLRPFFEVGAIWCPPSKLFGDALTDPRMPGLISQGHIRVGGFGDFPVQ